MISQSLDLFLIKRRIVLGYHSINEKVELNLTVLRRDFIKQISYLKKRNFDFVSPEEFIISHKKKKFSLLLMTVMLIIITLYILY